MISIDIDCGRSAAAELSRIGGNSKIIARNLDIAQNENQAAWQGSAGSEFQELGERLRAQISVFAGDVESIAGDILTICAEFEAANKIQ